MCQESVDKAPSTQLAQASAGPYSDRHPPAANGGVDFGFAGASVGKRIESLAERAARDQEVAKKEAYEHAYREGFKLRQENERLRAELELYKGLTAHYLQHYEPRR
jgi:hypothetical protein